MPSQDANKIIGLYDRHAAAFDRQRGRILLEKHWLDQFLALIPSGGAVLDLGCGMAEPIALYIIAGGYQITGVDSSPNMIRLCTARFPEQKWLVADMRHLSLAGRFAGILAWDSLFHLTPKDQRAMFAVFARHAAEHAALMFTSGPGFGNSIGTFEGEPLYHASLDPEEYRLLLARDRFEVVAHAVEDKSCGDHTVWLARRG